MEHQNEIQQTATQATADASKVGQILQGAREAMGLSVMDVANRIKFAPRQITALEEGDLSQLPEAAFVRGFVRSYAKLVQIDPNVLLESLPEQLAAPATPTGMTGKHAIVTDATTASTTQSNIIWLMAGLVVVVVLGVLAMLFDRTPEDNRQTAISSPTTMQTESVAASEVAPASEVVAQHEAAKPVTEAPAVAATEKKTDKEKLREQRVRELESRTVRIDESDLASKRKTAAVLNTTSLSPPVAAVSGISAASDVAAADTQKHKAARATIRMTFETDSWVEVKDDQGRVLLSRLHTPGSERILNGRPPFILSIGNAQGVKLYYKGKQIDLVPYTDVSVARLTLVE